MRPLIAVLALAGLAGCADWPDLDLPDADAVPADYPGLVPLEAVLGQAAVSPEDAEATEAANRALEARAEALRARARILSQPVADREALDRIRAMLARQSG